MEIKYTVTNNGSVSQDVGARVMLDTMIASNDAVPFNVPGTGAVTTEMEFTGANIPEYWQGFDTLTNPTLIAQGTLTTGGATTPDKFTIASWDEIYDYYWNYTVTPGQATGDSAVAIYWNPTTLAAGQSRTYTTYYGLGKVTIASGNLTAGLTATSTVSNCSNFTVVAYVSNVGGSTANDVAATISLPAGLMLSAGETSQKDMGNIANGSSNQSSWSVEPYGGVCGNMTITVTVTSSNVDSNTVNVTVNVPEACCVTTTTTSTINVTTTTTINVTTTTTVPTTTTTVSGTCNTPHSDPGWTTGSIEFYVVSEGCTQAGCGEGAGNATEYLIELRSGDDCGEQAWVWLDDVMNSGMGITPVAGHCYTGEIYSTTLMYPTCTDPLVMRYVLTEVSPCNECNDTTTTTTTSTTTILAEADAYEPDDTCSDATTISTDGTKQTHNFVPYNDQDWVKFTAVSGGVYTIETSELFANADTYLYLYDTDCVSLLSENDDYLGLESKIEWTATSSGTYYVKIAPYGGYTSVTSDTAYNVSVTGSSAVVNTSFFDNMESGTNGWTSTGFWHQETNPELVSIISGINPELVSLPDNGYLPSAYSGSTVWWYGENSTGTFIGSDYYTNICDNITYYYYNGDCQNPKGGGTSYAANTGDLISPTIDLTGVANSSLTFMSWYEIEGFDVDRYDMMYVYISTDGGVTYTQLGAINPINDVDGETFKSYSSGGLGLPGVWISQYFDISDYASSQTVIKFTFNTIDNLYNGFRGWIIDDVMVGTTGAAITPTIEAVAPSTGATGAEVVIAGTNFMNGASVMFGTTYATTVSVVSSSLIQVSVPSLADGTYDITVINPNAEQATSSNAFTVTTTYPPSVTSISPTSGTNDQPTAVTITGTNFESGATVLVGGSAVNNVVVVNSTSITGTVPAGLSGGYKNVKVTNPDSQYDVLMGGFYVNYTTAIEQITVTRTLPSTASPGGTFTVSLNLVVGGMPPEALGVTENVPSGWNVTATSPTAKYTPSEDKIEWLFWALGNPVENTTITYTVQVLGSANGTHTFSGTLEYGDVDDQAIAGDTTIDVSESALTGDFDGDGEVTLSEVIDAISMWYDDELTLADVIEAINNWASSG